MASIRFLNTEAGNETGDAMYLLLHEPFDYFHELDALIEVLYPL